MVCMRTIDVAFNNYERFDMAFVIDLCDNHVNDCLRVAQTVALESTPPLPLHNLMEISLEKVYIFNRGDDRHVMVGKM